MGPKIRRLAAWLLALALTVALVPSKGLAVLEDVYLTAVNEKVMPLTAETMPFWSDGILYVANQMFEGTDLGVTYVRNDSMDLAVLYTPRSDLRFDLAQETVCDKQGVRYSGKAIEKGSVVFFPLSMVCAYFGLTWSYNETDTVPLIRVTNSSAALEDSGFIDAAAGQMRSRYDAYEKLVLEQQQNQELPDEPPEIDTGLGQKVFLLLESGSPSDTLTAVERLGDARATFLLTVEQMENGDLLRCLAAKGHAVVLRLTGETEEELEEEIQQGRELLWQAACLWLDLVWYNGEEDVSALLENLGCARVTAQRDESGEGVAGAGRARTLLKNLGRYREDISVLLGTDSECLGGLEALAEGLSDAKYSICAWRLAG